MTNGSTSCLWCKNELPVDAKSNRKFCTINCAREYAKKEWRERNPKSPLGEMAKGTIAEANEMRVAIDLLKRGCEVYRAAFQGMPCDMLVLKPETGLGPIYRVEVTTGNYAPNGKLSHPTRDNANYDVLAVVVGDKIVYKPELWRE